MLREVIHDGVRYTLKYRSRPFREGKEVSVVVGDVEIKVGELGLGERALEERVRALIEAELKRAKQ